MKYEEWTLREEEEVDKFNSLTACDVTHSNPEHLVQSFERGKILKK